MKSRRGSTYWPGPLGGMVSQYVPGDIVVSVIAAEDSFIGIVREVHPKLNKVMVAWGGGSMVQHDPDEIQLSLHQTPEVKARMASRRIAKSEDDDNPQGQPLRSRRDYTAMTKGEANSNPQFVGNPETHGIDKPRGGGFSIMQNLQKDLRTEIVEEAEEGPKVADMKVLISSRHVEAKKKLRTTVQDNHGQTYVAWLEDGKLGPTLKLKEESGSTGGGFGWYVETLLGYGPYSQSKTISDKAWLDYGQDWYVTGMKKLLAEVKKNVKIVTVIASDLRSRRAFKKPGGEKWEKVQGKPGREKRRKPGSAGGYEYRETPKTKEQLTKDKDDKTRKDKNTKQLDKEWAGATDYHPYGYNEMSKEDQYKSKIRGIQQKRRDERYKDDAKAKAEREKKRVPKKKKEAPKEIFGPGIPKAAQLRSRRAMYWCNPERTYRLTKAEQGDGTTTCPKCKGQMESHPYKRGTSIYICPDCDFKISSRSVITEPPVLEPVIEASLTSRRK